MDWSLVLSLMTLHALTFLTIGPDNLLVVSKTTGQGFSYGMATILGIVCAGFIQVPLVVFGLKYVLDMNETVWAIIRCAGAAYLIYMGYGILKSTSERRISVNKIENEALFSSFFQGFATNLTNPKVLLILTVFLPQFVSIELGNVSFQLLALGLSMKINDLIWFTVTALVFLLAKQTVMLFLDRHNAGNLPKIFAGIAIVGVGLWMMNEAIISTKT